MTWFARYASMIACWCRRETNHFVSKSARSKCAAFGQAGTDVDRHSGRERLFGGGPRATLKPTHPFGRARIIPPHIPAEGTRRIRNDVFIFDCDDLKRRAPGRRGTSGANVVLFQMRRSTPRCVGGAYPPKRTEADSYRVLPARFYMPPLPSPRGSDAGHRRELPPDEVGDGGRK